RSQQRIGIGGDRIGNDGQQRDVVLRIAVEVAAFEIGERQAARCQPCVGVRDFTFAGGRFADQFAGRAAVGVEFRFGGDQVFDIECARDRCRDETVGGGDDDDQIAGILVL